MGEVQANGGIDDTNIRRYSKMEEKVNRLRSQILTSNNNLNLKSQFATSSWDERRINPYVFTEQGVAMFSGVLRGETAAKMSIQIINAFIAMLRFILSNAQVFQRLEGMKL